MGRAAHIYIYFRSDLIQHPLKSIKHIWDKDASEEGLCGNPSKVPKILIVGTHLDQIPLEDSEMEVFLNDISQRIEKEIGNKPYRQFVQYDTKDRSFWAWTTPRLARSRTKLSRSTTPPFA